LGNASKPKSQNPHDQLASFLLVFCANPVQVHTRAGANSLHWPALNFIVLLSPRKMPTILVVDDEPNIRDVVCYALKSDGFDTLEAANGSDALRAQQRFRPDLVVLDIIMPQMNGTDVCREIRRQDNTPIVFLTSKDDELDRIVGLELGGDDYVTKPFSPRELVARVRAVLRRSAHSPPVAEDASLRYGALELDIGKHAACWHGQSLNLTATEFGMLRVLISRPGYVFSRQQLMTDAYELRRVVSDRTIDSHIRRLRGKFRSCGDDPIETVHGVGYKLIAQEA
jgi:two-component system OmpR family response regulator